MRRMSLAAVMLLGLVGLPASTASATSVCGSITTSTTWTTADSPVQVTCPVVVYPGVTLTVDPGVTVTVATTADIAIRGVLNVAGTSSSHVVFQSASPPAKWGGISIENVNGGSAAVQYADLSYAAAAFRVQCCSTPAPLTLLDSTVSNSTTALSGYAGSGRVTVRRSTFSSNTQVANSGDKDFYDSTFTGNGCVLCSTERVNVYSSVFTNNTNAIIGARGVLKNSTLSGNTTAVQDFNQYGGMTMSKNTITGNGTGIVMPGGTSAASPITYNNIDGNTIYDVQVIGTANQNVGYNWWGTTNQATIDAGNKDGLDQAGLGLLLYTPLLTQAVTADTTPPDTSITSFPAALSSSPSATFGLASTEIPSTFQCQIDGGAFASCSTPKTYTGLAEGSHTFRVQATDNDANLDPTPASYTWTIDTVPPDTSIDSGPAGSANPPSGSFTFSSAQAAKFECSLDDDTGFSGCASPVSVGPLADGGHEFRVRAVDAAGNTDPSPAGRFWSVDGTPPAVDVLNPVAPGVYVNDILIPAGGNTPVVAGSLTIIVRATDAGSGVASFVLEIDGAPVPAAYDTPSGTYRYVWSGYLPGFHQIAATATDVAGLSTTAVQEVIGVVG